MDNTDEVGHKEGQSPFFSRRSRGRERSTERSRGNSISSSISSFSGASDLLSPFDNSRGSGRLLGRPGLRADSMSLDDKISPFSSALMPSSGSNFATPRNASPVGGEGISLPFSSPYRDDRSTLLKSHSFPQEGPLDGDASISTERRIDMDVNDGTAAGAGREAGNGGKSAGGINGLKRIFSSVPSPSHFRRSMSFAAISNAASRVAAGAMTPIRRRRHRRSASQGADVIDVSGRGNRGGRRTGDGGEGFVGSGESGRGSGKVKGRRRGSKDNRQCGRGAADTKLGWDSTKTGLLSPEDSPPRVNIFVDADASDADLRAVAKSTSAASSGIFFGDVGGRRKSSSTQVTPSRGRTRNRKDERQQKREAASCHREEGNQKSENSLQKASNGLAEWSWGPMSSTRRRGRSEHSHRQQAQTDELENRGRGDIARRHPSLEGRARSRKEGFQDSRSMPPLPLPPDRRLSEADADAAVPDNNASSSLEPPPKSSASSFVQQQRRRLDGSGSSAAGSGDSRPIETPPSKVTGVSSMSVSPPSAARPNFFGPSSGSTVHMFASSSLGARAARRARSASRGSLSVWAHHVATPKASEGAAEHDLTGSRTTPDKITEAGAVGEPKRASCGTEARSDRAAEEATSLRGNNAVFATDVKVAAARAATVAAAAAAAALNDTAGGNHADFVSLRTEHGEPKPAADGAAEGFSIANEQRTVLPRAGGSAAAKGGQAVASSDQESTANGDNGNVAGRSNSISDNARAPNLMLARASLRRVPFMKGALTALPCVGDGGSDVTNRGGDIWAEAGTGSGSTRKGSDRLARGRGRSKIGGAEGTGRRKPSRRNLFESPEPYVSDGSVGSSVGARSSGTNDNELSMSGSSDGESPSRADALAERRAALVAASMRSSEPPAPPPPLLVQGGSLSGENGSACPDATNQQQPPTSGAAGAEKLREHQQQDGRQDRVGAAVPAPVNVKKKAPLSSPKKVAAVLPKSGYDARGSNTFAGRKPSAVDEIPRNTVRAAVAKFDAKKDDNSSGLSGGPRAVTGVPRGILNRRHLVQKPNLARAGTESKVGKRVGAWGENAVRPTRSTDDLPPAEMGALGNSLSCALCGKEEKPSVVVANAGKGSSSEVLGKFGGEEVGVKINRCSRCRKGCCDACFKWLPVHCRGPNIVVPVCRDCFRCVDFENRWHDHLIAKCRPPEVDRHRVSPNGRQRRRQQQRPVSVDPLRRSASVETGEGVSPESARVSPTAPWEAVTDDSPSPVVAPRRRRQQYPHQGLFQTITLPVSSSAVVAETAQQPHSVRQATVNGRGSASSSGETARKGHRGRTASGGATSSGSWFGFALGSSGGGGADAGSRGGSGSAGGMFSSLTSAFSPRGPIDDAQTASAPRAIASEATARAIGSRTRWRVSPCRVSPGRASPVQLKGQDPADCRCGAAALYAEVIGQGGAAPVTAKPVADGDKKAVAGSVGYPMRAGIEAETEAKMKAHKLRRAKAYAHLLTRGQKALAYAAIQAKAFEFLRAQAALALSREALLSPAKGHRRGNLSPTTERPPPPGLSSTAPSSATKAAAAAVLRGGGGIPSETVVSLGTGLVPIGGGIMRNESAGSPSRKDASPAALVPPPGPGRVPIGGDILRNGAAGSPSRTHAPAPAVLVPPPGPAGPAVEAPTVSFSPHVVTVVPSPINMVKTFPQLLSGRDSPVVGTRLIPSESAGVDVGVRVPEKPSTTGVATLPDAASVVTPERALAASASRRRNSEETFRSSPSPSSVYTSPLLSPDQASMLEASDDQAMSVSTSLPATMEAVRGAVDVNGDLTEEGREEALTAAEEADAEATAAAAALRGREVWAEAERRARAQERLEVMVENVRRARALSSRKNSMANGHQRQQPHSLTLNVDDDSLGDESEDEGGSPYSSSLSIEESLGHRGNSICSSTISTSVTSSNGSSEGRRRKRLASPPPPLPLSPSPLMGSHQARGCYRGPGSRGVGAGEDVDTDFSETDKGDFDDRGRELLQLVKDREALFERMISGPGITATKFPRRGRPRTVVLTLSVPGDSSGSSSSNGEAKGGSDSAGEGGHRGDSVSGASTPMWRASGNSRSSVWGGGMDGDRSLRSGERSSSSKVRPQPRSLETLVKMELVWNRQRGGKGSLRVGEVVDALAGPQSQVLQPVCEDLRKRAAKRAGGQGGDRSGGGDFDAGVMGGEEDTFVSLLTPRRTLDLKFSTSVIRDRFLRAFKTFAWETSAAAGHNGRKPPDEVLRYYSRGYAAAQPGTSGVDDTYP